MFFKLYHSKVWAVLIPNWHSRFRYWDILWLHAWVHVWTPGGRLNLGFLHCSYIHKILANQYCHFNLSWWKSHITAWISLPLGDVLPSIPMLLKPTVVYLFLFSDKCSLVLWVKPANTILLYLFQKHSRIKTRFWIPSCVLRTYVTCDFSYVVQTLLVEYTVWIDIYCILI